MMVEARIRALRAAYRRVLRPGLFRIGGGDPERAHHAVVGLLGAIPPGLTRLGAHLVGQPTNPVTVAGIEFPGRVGFGAGLDKDGVAAAQWAGLGFGFMELGTVTALAQPGNPRPRLFRRVADEALVNRMGFNNDGAMALATRLRSLGVARGNGALHIPVGVSVGKSKLTPLADAAADYLASFEMLAGVPDYFAVNVSSPNTPGLRDLQSADQLRGLLPRLVEAASGTPVFVKLAPDMDDDALLAAARAAEDAGVSGLIATNTHLTPEGGLSGAPITARAVEVVGYLASVTELPLVGVGGIMSPRDAQRMFDAGASLVQVFSGFIYSGPALVGGINALTTPGGRQ